MAENLTKAKTGKLLQVLAELGGGQFSPEDDIISEGDKLILPKGMSMKQGAEFLVRRMEADQEQMNFSRKYKYRPWDGGVATHNALKKAFGMVGINGTPGSGGEDPPQMIDVPVGPNETIQVPWGHFKVPGMTNTVIMPSAYTDPELGPLYQLNINAPRKLRAQVEGIFAIVGEELATNSIYRGKAFDGQEMPEFLDLSGVDPNKVVYSEETLVQLDANVWSILRYRDDLKKAGISRKRSALLYGPYGTGKTLGGFLTAQIAVDNGWTFLYARPGKDNVEQVMQTARLYQPACVFFEDLDKDADPDVQSADGASRLLDIFDGITSKGTELMVVMTTNHPDRIHKGMLRPGRLDAVIEIGHLDETGVAVLIKTTLPQGTLQEHIDWKLVFAACEGFLPAYVKEIADRAYRYALSRSGTPQGILLSTEDLVHAANGLRPQLDLMNDAAEHERPDAVSEAFKHVVREAALEASIDLYPDWWLDDNSDLSNQEVQALRKVRKG